MCTTNYSFLDLRESLFQNHDLSQLTITKLPRPNPQSLHTLSLPIIVGSSPTSCAFYAAIAKGLKQWDCDFLALLTCAVYFISRFYLEIRKQGFISTLRP